MTTSHDCSNSWNTPDLHPVIDSTYALADAPAAFRKVVDGDVFGKVVLHIEPSK